MIVLLLLRGRDSLEKTRPTINAWCVQMIKCSNHHFFWRPFLSTIQNKGFLKSVKANIFNCASCQLPPILPQYTIHAARCLFIKPQSYSSVNKVHLEPSRVTLGRCTLYMVHPLFLLPVFFCNDNFFCRRPGSKDTMSMSMYSRSEVAYLDEAPKNRLQ